MIGETLGHYRVLEQIGAGGMGVVYRALDERLEREVALKVLPPGTLGDDSARKRFRREALALSQLNHPNIATVYDFDTQDGVDFLVLELIPGVTLDEKLVAGALKEKEIARLGIQMAQGLAAAHDKGVVHRDLKPGNLRVTPDGRLKILDFGLAALRAQETESAVTLSEALTAQGSVVGTVPYMAPEQLRGEKTDARADIYSAGAVLFEMATGRRPYPDLHGPQLIAAILQKAPPGPRELNPGLSPALESIIVKALDKDPERRYQSAKEMAVDLERGISPTVTSAQPVVQQRRPRWAGLAAAAAAAVLALMAGLNVGGLRDWVQSRIGAGRSPAIESLAVLPLEDLSGKPGEDYFADGMTDELITNMAQLGALRVISRPSVMRYKGSKKPLPEIARELGVDALVSGTVVRAGDRVRISAQLAEGRTDRQIWAEAYERDMRDVLSLQREVAQAIASEIRVKVTPQEKTRLAPARQVNPKAYEAYLRGRAAWSKQTEESLKKAIEFFQQAIAEDPLYSQAYAGMADSYFLLGIGFSPPKQVWPNAKAAALKATQMDDSLAEGHVSLGIVLAYYDWAWADAEREFKRAIELNPGYGNSHHWYGHYLHSVGRLDEALSEMNRAHELDPLSPYMSNDIGNIYYLRRDFDRAIEQSKKTIDLDASYYEVYEVLGVTYEQKGMFSDAIATLEKGNTLAKAEIMTGDLGHAYASWGKKAEAQKRLEDLQRRSKTAYVSNFDIALIYAGLGDKGRAFEALEKAVDERSFGLGFAVKVDPRFDPLRSDPRWNALLKQMGLAG